MYVYVLASTGGKFVVKKSRNGLGHVRDKSKIIDYIVNANDDDFRRLSETYTGSSKLAYRYKSFDSNRIFRVDCVRLLSENSTS